MPLAMLKTARVSPMPSPSVITTAPVKPGVRRKERNAYLMSLTNAIASPTRYSLLGTRYYSLCPQRHHGIHSCSSPSGENRGGQRRYTQQERRANHGECIQRFAPVEQMSEPAGHHHRSHRTGKNSDQGEAHTLTDHHAHQRPRSGSQRESNAQLRTALRHAHRHDPINPKRRQEQTQARQTSQQNRAEPAG